MYVRERGDSERNYLAAERKCALGRLAGCRRAQRAPSRGEDFSVLRYLPFVARKQESPAESLLLVLPLFLWSIVSLPPACLIVSCSFFFALYLGVIGDCCIERVVYIGVVAAEMGY